MGAAGSFPADGWTPHGFGDTILNCLGDIRGSIVLFAEKRLNQPVPSLRNLMWQYRRNNSCHPCHMHNRSSGTLPNQELSMVSPEFGRNSEFPARLSDNTLGQQTE